MVPYKQPTLYLLSLSFVDLIPQSPLLNSKAPKQQSQTTMTYTLHKAMLHSRNVAMQQCSYAAILKSSKASKLQSCLSASLPASMLVGQFAGLPRHNNTVLSPKHTTSHQINQLFLCICLILFKKFLIKSLPSTINLPIMCITKSMDAQLSLVRASALQAEGHRFESYSIHHK